MTPTPRPDNPVMVSRMKKAEVPIPRTAIVPAAGLGTRFLPATKTVPKELLPVVDTPGIELVATEAAVPGDALESALRALAPDVRAVPILAADDAAALHHRIQVEEHRLLPAVVQALAAGRIAVAGRVESACAEWKKTPVRCKSTPGFIVNRVARPYYGEAFRVLEAGGADVPTIDLVLREVGAFKLGTFELLDLIGLDVNLMVTKSVWNAYYQDSRFRPSLTQEEMVAGGLLGRKSGRGFYTYPAEPTAPAPSPAAGAAPTMVQYLTESDALDPLIERIKAAGIKVQSRKEDDPYGAGMLRAGNATICLTDGRTATQIAFEEDLTNVLTLDLARDFATTKRVALAKGEDTTTSAVADAVALFKALGVEVTMVGDVPGMIVARTVSMLANEAADAVLQGVADAAGVDTAMKLGVSYPEGPLAAADRYGLTLMNAVLVNMQAHTGDDRYRQSLLLQRKMWSDGSFT